MGYPNPAESPFDLFMTGHAGCAPRRPWGSKSATSWSATPTGTRSPSSATAPCPPGIVFEAFNHASGLKKKLLVILNDNKMSICPRVGGLADYLDRARMSSTYNDWNKRVKSLLPNDPPGRRARRALAPAAQGRDQGLAAPRDALRGARVRLPRPDRRPRPQDLAQLPRAGQGAGWAGPAPRPDQQGARLRAGR